MPTKLAWAGLLKDIVKATEQVLLCCLKHNWPICFLGLATPMQFIGWWKIGGFAASLPPWICPVRMIRVLCFSWQVSHSVGYTWTEVSQWRLRNIWLIQTADNKTTFSEYYTIPAQNSSVAPSFQACCLRLLTSYDVFTVPSLNMPTPPQPGLAGFISSTSDVRWLSLWCSHAWSCPSWFAPKEKLDILISACSLPRTQCMNPTPQTRKVMNNKNYTFFTWCDMVPLGALGAFCAKFACSSCVCMVPLLVLLFPIRMKGKLCLALWPLAVNWQFVQRATLPLPEGSWDGHSYSPRPEHQCRKSSVENRWTDDHMLGGQRAKYLTNELFCIQGSRQKVFNKRVSVSVAEKAWRFADSSNGWVIYQVMWPLFSFSGCFMWKDGETKDSR